MANVSYDNAATSYDAVLVEYDGATVDVSAPASGFLGEFLRGRSILPTGNNSRVGAESGTVRTG